ncbi:hypothetical protein DASC09_039470 [Saccharomycopsis crataegensis]|uniref:Major facilitator superfamily (MFS) profile domain-containing protein n=1 Tax=Saccharomycopsis crataegensis TaxID=43959 RepID=A0AAV5QQ42_9ASCO|nr:hypothetical protein DASC09_039470 [Saccharomycopsis crataegensis]
MSIKKALLESPRDTRLLWLSAFLRLTAFGASNIVLTAYLAALGVSESRIGIFMTTTLVGDVVLSYILTWYADIIGRRRIMFFGSLFMVLAGLMFAQATSFWWLLFAAIIGVISPTGDEIGPFKSIEESAIAHLTPLSDRASVYAWHWLISCAGQATGTLFSGIFIQKLQDNGWQLIESYRAVFYVYAILAAGKCITMLFLSEKAEMNHSKHISISETMSLLTDDEEREQSKSKIINLSKETSNVLKRLLCIFMIDSFAAGFMPSSWLVYYFSETFSLNPKTLGSLFFSTSIANSLSSLPSSIFARALGPVKATLSVQVPSCLLLISIPFSSNFYMAVVELVLFYSTTAMDVVPRQVILTNLINPSELTRAMGIVNVGKTFARCIGPSVIGKLAGEGYLWTGFIINGGLTLVADFMLWIMFYGVDEKIKMAEG